MKYNILLSDTFHVHGRNFRSLFEVLSEEVYQSKALKKGSDLWNRYGDYCGIKRMEAHAEQLQTLPLEHLSTLSATVLGTRVNAFDIARSEILSLVLAKRPNWFENDIPNEREFILKKLYDEDRFILCLNLAAVIVWCEIYSEELSDINSYHAAVVFSGSQIYQRLLLAICSSRRTRAFVVESFQTGTEFYFEERYSPITAGCDIRHEAIYRSLALPVPMSARQNEINKAQNKLFNAQNKNVTQPPTALLPEFKTDAPVVMLSAQVQNDFSIVESQLQNLNALGNYKEIIKEIVNKTDCNVIVKTHPWEKKKTHLRTSFIFENLSEYVRSFPDNLQERIYLCEDANIKELMNASDVFVTLTSQSAFEACFFSGLRPFVLGRPFYGGRGFTNDFDDIPSLVKAIGERKDSWTLSLEAFDAFNVFLTKLLQLQLPSIYKSGVSIVQSRLKRRQFVEVGITPPSPPPRVTANSASSPTKPAGEAVHETAAASVAGSPSRPEGELAKTANKKLKESVRFRAYASLYGKFLSPQQKHRLTEDPYAFLSRARHPVSILGRNMFKNYLN